MRNELKTLLSDEIMMTDLLVIELNSYNNCLDFLRYQSMDEFNYTMRHESPIDIALAIQHGSFNAIDDLFQIDSLGHLYSCSYGELEKMYRDNIDEIVDNLIEYANDIPLPVPVAEILTKAGVFNE